MLKKFGLVAFILTSVLYAEENVIKLNESVISSQNFKTNIKNTAANISIITAKEMEEKGAKDLADALRMVPGIMAKTIMETLPLILVDTAPFMLKKIIS